MRLSIHLITSFFLFSLFAPTACSSQSVADSNEKAENEKKQVVISWHEPKKYTDVRSPDGFHEDYRENVFYQLDKHFQKIAKKSLPEGYTMKLKVVDLNLAGDTRFHMIGHQHVRLIKPLYWPSMEFEYELYDGNKLVKTDLVKIKDMSFMERSSVGRNFDSLNYEKRLIKDWFDKDLEVVLMQWQRRKTAVMS